MQNNSGENVENINTPSQNIKKKSYAILVGKSSDSTALRFINLIDHSSFFSKNYPYQRKTISNDSVIIKLDSLSGRKLFDLQIFGSNLYHLSKIIISPGDTIHFDISKNQLEFGGENKSVNAILYRLQNTKSNYNNNPLEYDLDDYKNRTINIYKDKLRILESYNESQNIAVDDYNLIKKILKFDYLNNLINPRSIYNAETGWYLNNMEGINSELSQRAHGIEKAPNLFDYFDNVKLDDFNQPDLLENSWEFKDSFDAFLRYYFSANENLPYSKDAFLDQKLFIEQHLDGDLKNYAILRMLREYHVRGFGHSRLNIGVMKNTINEYKLVFIENPSYLELINEINSEINSYDMNIPPNIDSQKVINYKKDTLELGDIIKNNKIKIIDFWATWCLPCVKEINNRHKTIEKLRLSTDVNWIFLSIDSEFNSWEEFMNNNSDIEFNKNSFFIIGGKNSKLAKFFHLNSIPRYILLSDNNNIILENAPQPSNINIYKEIISSF